MKVIYNTFIYDWKHNKIKLIVETLGSFLFMVSLSMLSYYGDDVNTRVILILNLLGSLCLLGYSWIVGSANLILLNLFCIAIASLGIFK